MNAGQWQSSYTRPALQGLYQRLIGKRVRFAYWNGKHCGGRKPTLTAGGAGRKRGPRYVTC